MAMETAQPLLAELDYQYKNDEFLWSYILLYLTNTVSLSQLSVLPAAIYLVFAFQKVEEATTARVPTSPDQAAPRKRPITDPEDNAEPSSKQTRTVS